MKNSRAVGGFRRHADVTTHGLSIHLADGLLPQDLVKSRSHEIRV